MNKIDKVLFGIVAAILLVTFLFFFCAALLTTQHGSEQNQLIRVYINENDSLIYKLQQDVERLSTIIDKLSADTLVLEVRRPNIIE